MLGGIREAGRAFDGAAGFEAGVDAGLAIDFAAAPDVDVAGDSGLAADDDVIFDGGAASEADLAADEAVFADDDVVAYVDEIIEFGAFADDGFAEAGAVEGGVGTDFDVVVDDDTADLGNFLVAAGREFVAEAVGADNDAGVQADAVTEDAFGGDGGAGHEPAIGADADFAAEKDLGLEVGAFADDGAGFDDAERADGGGGGDVDVGSDDGRGVNAGLGFRPEHLFESGAEAGEADRGFFEQEEELVGLGVLGGVKRKQDDRGVGGGDFGFIFWVAQKGEVTGVSGLERGDATHVVGGGATRRRGLDDLDDLGLREGKLHGLQRARVVGSGNRAKRERQKNPARDERGFGELVVKRKAYFLAPGKDTVGAALSVAAGLAAGATDDGVETEGLPLFTSVRTSSVIS